MQSFHKLHKLYNCSIFRAENIRDPVKDRGFECYYNCYYQHHNPEKILQPLCIKNSKGIRDSREVPMVKSLANVSLWPLEENNFVN